MNTDSIKTHATDAMQWAGSGSKLTYSAIGVGLVVALILFKVFFKDFPGLFHCIGYSISSQPNGAAAGQATPTAGSRIKLLFGLALPIGAAYASYVYLPRLFPTVFPG